MIMIWPRVIFCLFSLLFIGSGAIAGPKKTLCTITINSADERDTFRKYLRSSEFDIVELVPNQRRESDEDDDEQALIPTWLEQACKKGIKCDSLVISGHFAGSFFGGSGYSLSMEQLERAACRSECAGIVERPKEVFLFGCNTLAGKERDVRTPRSYLEALHEHDNLTEDQRQQAVAFRYSPWGGSSYIRMSSIFRNSAKIYGFDSIGPSGRTAKPFLSAYLSKTGANYSQALDKMDKRSPPNELLARILKPTSFVESTGLDQPDHHSAICYLENEQVATVDKLNFMENNLTSKEPFKYAPAMASWLEGVLRTNTYSSVVNDPIFVRIRDNRSVHDQFINLVEMMNDLPVIQKSILSFAMNLKWISWEDLSERMKTVILRMMSDGIVTRSEADTMCSLHMAIFFGDTLPMSRAQLDFNAVDGLTCLGNAQPVMLERLVELIPLLPQNQRGRAISILEFISGRNENAQTLIPFPFIQNMFLRSADDEDRYASARLLIAVHQDNIEAIRWLADKACTHPNPLWFKAIDNISSSRVKNLFATILSETGVTCRRERIASLIVASTTSFTEQRYLDSAANLASFYLHPNWVAAIQALAQSNAAVSGNRAKLLNLVLQSLPASAVQTRQVLRQLIADLQNEMGRR